MLTVEENELLTRIGPGTRMGALLRRYWHPVAAASEMGDRWTKRVRLLGEDLVLFKDRSGKLGLIGEFCPHRRASLAYGIPESDGIRCPYHGWKFDALGTCLEQPNEPEGSSFKDKVASTGYPVQEFAGLLWGYLGPLPAPLIPALDGFVVPGTIRTLGKAIVRCNWLQIMENSLDPVHAEWLHGHYHQFVKECQGTPMKVAFTKKHVKIGFDEFEYGIIKRRMLENTTEESDDWKIGHPMIFPNILGIGNAGKNWHEYRFQIRVPIDDENTQHYWYGAFVPPEGVSVPQRLLDQVHVYDVPIRDADGEYIVETTYGQDIMAWETQGAIADRSQEALGATDRGITLYRRMLQRELQRVEAGEDPKNVLRDPALNQQIDLPLERDKRHRDDGFEINFRRHQARYSPIADDLIAIYAPFSPKRVAS